MNKINYYLRGKPKYCSVCGRKMKKEEIPIEFNSQTGKLKKVKIIISCPNFNYEYIGYHLYGSPAYSENGHTYFKWEEER
jgi:hypothetical protein